MILRRNAVLISLVVAFLGTGASTLRAQSYPSMKGVWSGTGKTIVLGLAPHHKDNPAATAMGDYRLSEIKFTITIDGQQENRFWGKISSSVKTETLVGAFAADGKRFRIVQRESGVLDGNMLSGDKFEVLYSDAKPDFVAVGTNEYTREK